MTKLVFFLWREGDLTFLEGGGRRGKRKEEREEGIDIWETALDNKKAVLVKSLDSIIKISSLQPTPSSLVP